ncbi:MAG: alanine racemase [Chloroflexi bacterium]|nr:alanine racemase [Chloroflexota bacterium]
MTTSSPGTTGTPLESATRALNAWIELELDALDNNAHVLRETAGDATVMAVVKANAYGHGADVVGPALEAAGIERFAVVFLPEAVALREAGVTRPVLVLGHSFAEDAETAVAHDITLTVDGEEQAAAVADAALRAGKAPVPVHVKVDSGMHRFGLAPDEVAALADRVRTLEGVTLEALWTHLANADHEDDSFTIEQDRVVAEAVRLAGPVPMRHIANTATTIRHPEFRYDAVRTGLGLYGALPDHTPNPGLQRVLSMKARLARVFDVSPGEGVSYGLTWVAERQSRVALVPIGYADGYHRALSNRGHVLAGGRRCPIVGRICMDQFLIDVTGVPGVSEGDEAVLIGEQGGETITAAEVAGHIDTINYEVLAGLNRRLPRLGHRKGIVEATC